MPRYYGFTWNTRIDASLEYYLFKKTNRIEKCSGCNGTKQIYNCIYLNSMPERAGISNVRIFCKQCLIRTYQPELFNAKTDEKAIELYKAKIIVKKL